MTGTMKRAVSVILVLAMAVAGLSYTPKMTRAEELTFAKLELSGYGSIWYAIKGTNGFIGWVNPWYGDAGTTLQFIYSAVNTNVKATINGQEKTVENSDGLVKEIADGSLKINPQKLSATGTTEVVLSADGGKSVTVVVTKSDPAYGIPEDPTSGDGTSTLKALEDAYVYNFVESGEGFKVGFSDPNEVTATDGGTYTLIESVETGSSRVDIDIDYAQEDTDEIVEGAEPDTVTINGTKYETYDALIELANDANENRYDSEAYYFRTGLEIFSINEPERTNSNYDYVPNATNKPEFVKKTQIFVQGFETALQSGNYDTFCQYIDVDSFVDFYITSELFMTKDINFSSTRFYIRDGKLYAGPLWDLDLSSGNIVDHASFEDFYAQNFQWFKLLMQNETFETKVKARYAQLQGRIENLYARGGAVDTAYNTIQASAKHNYEDAYNKKIGLTDNNGGYNIGWKYIYIYIWKRWIF